MKILIAVEDRDYARAIAATVAAQNYNDELHFKILNVVEPVFFHGMGSQTDEAGESGLGQGLVSHDLVASIAEERRRNGRAMVMNLGTSLKLRYPGAAIEELVVEDTDAKKRIIDTANEWRADLVVMGSHGRSGIERLFLGSVSLAVLAHVQCSVLVVKLPKARLTEADQGKLAEHPRSLKV